MAMKKIRNIKGCEQSDYHCKPTPIIMLKEVGFAPGTSVKVRYMIFALLTIRTPL